MKGRGQSSWASRRSESSDGTLPEVIKDFTTAELAAQGIRPVGRNRAQYLECLLYRRRAVINGPVLRTLFSPYPAAKIRHMQPPKHPRFYRCTRHIEENFAPAASFGAAARLTGDRQTVPGRRTTGSFTVCMRRIPSSWRGIIATATASEQEREQDRTGTRQRPAGAAVTSGSTAGNNLHQE